jgi:hypothetical protein
MYLNRWVMLASCIAGIIGIVALVDAFREYRGTIRTYSEVEFTHAPESLVWSDNGATLTVAIRIENDSPATVTVEYLGVRLHVDGAFAGADYGGWQPLAIPPASRDQRDVTIELSNRALRERASAGRLTLRGEARLRFDGIARPLTQRFTLTIDAPPVP